MRFIPPDWRKWRKDFVQNQLSKYLKWRSYCVHVSLSPKYIAANQVISVPWIITISANTGLYRTGSTVQSRGGKQKLKPGTKRNWTSEKRVGGRHHWKNWTGNSTGPAGGISKCTTTNPLYIETSRENRPVRNRNELRERAKTENHTIS